MDEKIDRSLASTADEAKLWTDGERLAYVRAIAKRALDRGRGDPRLYQSLVGVHLAACSDAAFLDNNVREITERSQTR